MKLQSIFSDVASFIDGFIPKTLKADADKAFVVTKFNPFLDDDYKRYVVKDAAALYVPATTKDITEVSLKSETIHYERGGKDSITLGDMTKADVALDFEVGVDGSSEESIIAAAILRPTSLEYLGPKFDSALRAVGAQSSSLADFSARAGEMIERAIDVKHYGLKPVRAKSVSAQPTPASFYDPADYFDSKGLKIAYPDLPGPRIPFA